MEDSKCWKIIIKALSEKDVDITCVTMDSTFIDIGLDSLDIFSLIISIEQEYGIKLKDEELAQTKTIRNAFNLLEKYIQ